MNKVLSFIAPFAWCVICEKPLPFRVVYHWAKSRCGPLCHACADKQEAELAEHDGWPCEDRD